MGDLSSLLEGNDLVGELYFGPGRVNGGERFLNSGGVKGGPFGENT